MADWHRLNEICRLDSPWISLCCERWRTTRGGEVDYWRVEKADSLIILPRRGDLVFAVTPQYRPGTGEATIDLPGGRLKHGESPTEAAARLLEGELGLAASAFTLEIDDPAGVAVDSSTSSQRLYWAAATLPDPVADGLMNSSRAVPLDSIGGAFERISCLQCRYVLLEAARRGLISWS